MSLTGLREIEEIARQVNAARRARDRRARASRPEAVARRLPSLMRWIPKVSPHLDAPTHLEPLVRELERVLRAIMATDTSDEVMAMTGLTRAQLDRHRTNLKALAQDFLQLHA